MTYQVFWLAAIIVGFVLLGAVSLRKQEKDWAMAAVCFGVLAGLAAGALIGVALTLR